MRFPLLASLITLAFLSHGQNVERIIEKHYEAYNQDFWDEIKTASMRGVWFRGNEKLYAEFLVKKNDKIAVRGKDGADPYIEVTNGKGFWTVAPWTGIKKPQLMLVQEEYMLKNVWSFGSPIGRGTLLEYLGEVKENGIPSYWLRERKGEDIAVDYFIDKHDYYLRKMNIRTQIAGFTEPLTKTFDQFRKFGPAVVPTVIVLTTRELEREYVFDDMVIGDGISDAVFNKPE